MAADGNSATKAIPTTETGRAAEAIQATGETRETQRNGFWDRHGREVITIGLWLLLVFVVLFVVYFLFMTKPDIREDPDGDIVKMVYYDAAWFHKLYVRWTITDWTLTFLAAGTAVSAAIRNTYSSKKGTEGSASSMSSIDIILIVLAVLTVLATTFDGKLHAAQLAEKYRWGDLHLQTAKFYYAAHKDDHDAKEQLLTAWREAQDYLASPSAVPPRATGAGSSNSPGTAPTTQAPPAQVPGTPPKPK